MPWKDLGLENGLKSPMDLCIKLQDKMCTCALGPDRDRAFGLWLFTDVTFASLLCWPGLDLSVVFGDTESHTQ